MTKPIYITLVVLMLAFALSVIAFVTTSNIFQLLLAVFNLLMLFNTLCVAVELEL